VVHSGRRSQELISYWRKIQAAGIKTNLFFGLFESYSCCFRGSETLKSGGMFGVNSPASSCGLRVAFMKSLRRVEPSANWSWVAWSENRLVSKVIINCGIILRAAADRGCKTSSQRWLVALCDWM